MSVGRFCAKCAVYFGKRPFSELPLVVKMNKQLYSFGTAGSARSRTRFKVLMSGALSHSLSIFFRQPVSRAPAAKRNAFNGANPH